MTIRINGEERPFPAPVPVTTLLEALGLPRTDVAVAVDGEVVPRSQWDTHLVGEGADIDVVTAVQGG